MLSLNFPLGDVSIKKLGLWDELVAIVQDLVLANEEDQMVWNLNSSRVYSSKYVVLNFRGITLDI
jgi:hypothetical protein